MTKSTEVNAGAGELAAFLAAHPDVQAVELLITDPNGVGNWLLVVGRRQEHGAARRFGCPAPRQRPAASAAFCITREWPSRCPSAVRDFARDVTQAA
jgi:hypothetical protein